jgi:hypothetical protein
MVFICYSDSCALCLLWPMLFAVSGRTCLSADCEESYLQIIILDLMTVTCAAVLHQSPSIVLYSVPSAYCPLFVNYHLKLWLITTLLILFCMLSSIDSKHRRRTTLACIALWWWLGWPLKNLIPLWYSSATTKRERCASFGHCCLHSFLASRFCQLIAGDHLCTLVCFI